MKVYVLTGYMMHEGSYTMGVYATREDAYAAWDLYEETHPQNLDGCDVEEVEFGAEARFT